MLLSAIQMCGETLSAVEVKDICDSMLGHQVRLLSLRECTITDQDFKQLMKCLALCKSILQLNLNVGVVSDAKKISWLAAALERNRSLTSLFLYGNTVGDQGLEILSQALISHPSLTSLDLGDCGLTDKSMQLICDLLPQNGAKPGLKELTLSANPDITLIGWSHLFIAMAASSVLERLHLDYNNIGNYGAGCLAVAMASCKKLNAVDLEGCNIGETGGKLILHLLENYPVKLQTLVLDENKIKVDTMADIMSCCSCVHYHSGDDAGLASSSGPAAMATEAEHGGRGDLVASDEYDYDDEDVHLEYQKILTAEQRPRNKHRLEST